jgi:hypothetical protein
MSEHGFGYTSAEKRQISLLNIDSEPTRNSTYQPTPTEIMGFEPASIPTTRM